MKNKKLKALWQAGLALSMVFVLGACSSQGKDTKIYDDKADAEQAKVVDNSDKAEESPDKEKESQDKKEQAEATQKDNDQAKETKSDSPHKTDDKKAAKTTESSNSSGQVDHAKAEEARKIIAQVVGIKVSDLDGYTDEQILAAQKASEDVGGDPGYSYQYLKDNF